MANRDTPAKQLETMDLKTAETILGKCAVFVYDLCTRNRIAPDHGYQHALHVLLLAHVGLSDFDELSISEALLVRLAALMHDIDDPKVFSTEDYSNARRFLASTPLSGSEQEKVIHMIALVSYSQNKNETPPELPKWMFIPRDADRITGGGANGIKRTIEFNQRHGGCPLLVDEDVKMFESCGPVITADDVRNQFNASRTRKRSLFEFYITNWFNRGICASGGAKLKRMFALEYTFLLNFWVEQLNEARKK
jgi:uncharacterized protein